MSTTLDEIMALAEDATAAAAREGFMPGGYASAREALRSRLAAIVEDAERYHFLTRHEDSLWKAYAPSDESTYNQLDAAIDAARNQTKEPQ